jgi:putative tricarboxylic transport membrane protein
MSDRIAGLVLAAFVLWYGTIAFSIRNSFFSDPLGSRAFPVFVALFLAPLALYLLVRRTGDRPVWADRASWPALVATLVIFVAYALLMEPLGFLVANVFVFTALAYVFGAPRVRGAVAAVVATGVMYVVFGVLLDLYIPFGEVFERWRP